MNNNKKYIKAIQAVNENRVIKISFYPSGFTLNVVKSSRHDMYYLVYPEIHYCTCNDFFFNNILRKKKTKCYHLIAYEIAKRKNHINELKYRDKDFKKIYSKIIKGIIL